MRVNIPRKRVRRQHSDQRGPIDAAGMHAGAVGDRLGADTVGTRGVRHERKRAPCAKPEPAGERSDPSRTGLSRVRPSIEPPPPGPIAQVTRIHVASEGA